MLETLTEPFKRLSRRLKRERASKNYATNLRTSLNSSYKQQLERYKRTSLEAKFEGEPEEQMIRELKCNLYGLNLNDKLQIRQVETKKILAEGSAVYKGSEVRIKLLKPLFFNKSDLSDNRNKFLIRSSTKQIKSKKACNERAIRRFEQVKCSTVLHDLILGNYKDERNVRFSRSRLAPINHLPALKGNQLVAAKNAMMRRISLVEGVAGSGKTLVAAHIINSLCMFKKAKVLFCSPVESGVNTMVQMIGKLDYLSVVKLGCKNAVPDESCLDQLIDKALYNKTLKCLSRLHAGNISDRITEKKLHEKSLNAMKNCSNWSRNKMQKAILKRAKVVCCTISDSAGDAIKNLHFDVLILDDTHLTTEADCFPLLMTKGLKQVILLSEMRHDIRFARLSSMNGSMITMESSGEDQFASLKRKYTQSYRNSQRKHAQSNRLREDLGGLFERLLYMGLTTVALNKQFRMHECLSAFSKAQFYLSMMRTDSIVNSDLTERVCRDIESASGGFDWLPDKKQMTTIFPVKGECCSYEKLGIVLSKLIDSSGIETSRIGVICNDRMEHIENLGAEIGTVEDFVGRHKDYIILHTVNHCGKETPAKLNNFDVNFRNNDNSLNIALTRARLGLFIITNIDDVDGGSCKSWRDLIDYYSKHELIVKEEVTTYHPIDVEETHMEELNSQ